ncbi:DUF2304 domain-containing protein [Paenibacillus methanolicus]|uniref:DUF2304 domain-containing protein n=1 Tax=Paenibacillus methanolicus TaxID=582686 RepID=A0A5S5BSQ8_9BACL|nr:DUF2304 domain-containing protein [Paenibacillus methanolicus]TYP70099.1 hypothetical protein BCM02_11277 [Paenibacillus methanolicus]
MADVLRWFVLLCGLSFSGIIIRLLLRHKISARNSVVWLLSAAIILGLSAYPSWFNHLAWMLGINYPPTLLFLLSTLVLLVMVLHLSIQLSIMNEKIRQMAQHIAISDLEQQELAHADKQAPLPRELPAQREWLQ